MVSIFDVVVYILQQKGSMTSWKLQRLCYYCRVWSVVWDDSLLFSEEIYAWPFNPICVELYDKCKGVYQQLDSNFFQEGDSNKLSKNQKESIDVVLDFYSDEDEDWLDQLTRTEDPWKDARVGLSDRERGTVIITKEAIKNYYYGSLNKEK